MRKHILLCCVALTLTACASGRTPTPAPTLSPPASEMVACSPLPPPESGQLNDLLTNHIAVAKLYHQCRDRLQALIDWLEVTTDALRSHP